MPVTLETLMRGFRGKQYEDVTGQMPPRAAVEDTAQGNVAVPPRVRRDDDYWEVQGEWLVRFHVKPRLAMLVPSKMKNIPIAEEDLSGGGNVQELKDNFKTHENPARCLLDRWTGETRCRIKPDHPAVQSARPPGQEASAEPRDQPESSSLKRRSQRPSQREALPKSSKTTASEAARPAGQEASAERRDQPESSRGPLEDDVLVPGRLVPGTPTPGTPVPSTPRGLQEASGSQA